MSRRKNRKAVHEAQRAYENQLLAETAARAGMLMKQGRTLEKLDDGRVVDLIDVPEWTVKTYNKVGAITSTALFLLIMVVMWPAVASLSLAGVAFVGSVIVTIIPNMVLGGLDTSATVLLSTTDRFVFSWLVPVLFVVLVFAACVSFGLITLFKYLGELSNRLYRGLVSGHGESTADNAARRKKARKEKLRVAKENRTKERDEYAEIKKDVRAAIENNDQL